MFTIRVTNGNDIEWHTVLILQLMFMFYLLMRFETNTSEFIFLRVDLIHFCVFFSR